MLVGLITSWPPIICGIASHNVNLVNHRQPGVEYKIINGAAWVCPFTHEQIMRESQDCAIVHLSYERNLCAGLQPDTFWQLRNQGKKLVITYHNVWPGDHQDDAMLAPFDVVISQDPQSPAERGFTYIPQGVMEIETVPDDKVEMKLGTAGFPTHYKGAHIMAEVAAKLGLKVLLFAPASIHANADAMARDIRAHVPDAEIVFDFLSQEEIVKRLSECVATCWLYTAIPEQSGISGSVRLGFAAKRPVVLTRVGMYRDTFDYGDEIYFVDSATPTVENVSPIVKQALCGARRPKRIVQDMSWHKCGEMYAATYRKLIGREATA